MDDLLADFLTETNENLAELDLALVTLERTPDDAATLALIFRMVHTIKGTCGFLGLPRLERVAHAGESVLGKVRDGDIIEIVIDRNRLEGQVNLVGPGGVEDGSRMLEQREPRPGLAPDPNLPDDTRLWAALQDASGGAWAGAVYDVDRILRVLEAGRRALGER